MPADSSTSTPDPSAYPARHYRTVLFYGEERFRAIRRATVAIIGLGGVGGHAAINLARSGIGGLHLVDFDVVSESSLNRSPYAAPSDVGRPKTEVLRSYLRRICPDTPVAISNLFCRDNTLALIVPPFPAPDLVIDAIDSLNPKVGLIDWCHRHDVPVITSLGAAGKSDVGKVRTGDLSESTICPLARKVRTRLKRRGVTEGVPAIWSIEKAEAHRPEAPKEMGEREEDPKPDDSRERHTLASQMTLPGVFGYGLASLALDLITRKDFP